MSEASSAPKRYHVCYDVQQVARHSSRIVSAVVAIIGLWCVSKLKPPAEERTQLSPVSLHQVMNTGRPPSAVSVARNSMSAFQSMRRGGPGESGSAWKAKQRNSEYELLHMGAGALRCCRRFEVRSLSRRRAPGSPNCCGVKGSCMRWELRLFFYPGLHLEAQTQ